jgi:tetratricopeptide (TPR) repeat protein
MAKIALTMICKDESSELNRLRRCLKTAEYQVDGIFLVFNSNDRPTMSKKARELADFFDITYIVAEWKENFGEMRTLCASQVPDEYDWILWLDADDELAIDPDAGSLKEIADSAKGIDGLFARYNYDFNANGQVTEEHDVIRMYRNNGNLKWVGRIHETLIEQRRSTKGNTPDFWVNHRVDEARRNASLARNIRLLEAELESEGDQIDPRTLYYLGSSYYDAGQLVKARELLESYLLMSGWDAERAQAQVWLGRIAMKEDRSTDAKNHFSNALVENPKEVEAYIELGAAEALDDHYHKAIVWLELAISLRPDQGAAIARSPFDNKYRPYIILSECYLQLGGEALPTALHWAEKAYEISKDDVSKNQVDMIKSILEERKSVNAFMAKARAAIKSKQPGDKILAKNHHDKLPEEIKANPAVIQAMNQLNGPTVWPKNSVAIFCGNSVLKGWGPWSLDSGIGGSEEAVIRISKHLTNQGYKVVVFAEPLARDGVYDDVEWRNYWEMNGQDHFDIFIGWRNPWMFDADIKANKKYLWIHDVMETSEFTEERLNNLDKVMLLSDYHRTVYPAIPDNKIFMTGNGIDSDEFAELDDKLERNPHKVIYTSSHVRGLEHLYTIWPEVKKAVPDARLDIFYGWDSYVKVNRDNPERMAWKDKMIRWEKRLDGVTDNGRIGQDQIMEETFKAGVWAYPCPFPEIYCIAAVKAQAAGAFPVCSDFAALDEMVQWGEKINMDDFNDEILEQYKQKLISILLDSERQDKERAQMMEWARKNKSWASVAEQWIKEFQS